jgi:hypothetical protein
MTWPEQEADIAIVTLSQSAPLGVPRCPLYDGTDEVSRTGVLVGYGAAGHGSMGIFDDFDTEPTKRAGLNRI